MLVLNEMQLETAADTRGKAGRSLGPRREAREGGKLLFAETRNEGTEALECEEGPSPHVKTKPG